MQCGTAVPTRGLSGKALPKGRMALFGGIGAGVGAVIVGTVWLASSRPPHSAATATPAHASHRHRAHETPAPVSRSPESQSALITKTMASVVEVVATTPAGADLGSGFVYDNQGDILTNDHVVSGATSVGVKTETGQIYPATIIGADPSLDVAALHVSRLSLAPLTVNAHYAGALGDNILAFGSPLGLSDTVTTGIISGLNRSFTIHGVHYQNMFQISAPIAPGNSGGPLVLLASGAVVGMDTAGVTSSSGNIGFAIPMSEAYPPALVWAAHPESHPSTLLPSSNPSPSYVSPSPSSQPSPSGYPSPSPSPSPSAPPSPSPSPRYAPSQSPSF